MTFPGGMSYTPGVAQQLTVTVSQTGQSRWGFELSARDSGNAQAGSFASTDSNAQILTSGSLQYVAQSSGGTQAGTANSASWNVTWTPPATASGNITFYADGLACNNNGGTSGDDNYTASYVVAPASTPPPSTLTVSPATLSFTVNGAQPPSQTVQVTSSGASVDFTTSASVNGGGAWLSATPPGGTTPLGVTVAVDATGLAAGTYTGIVAVASSAASNTPQNVNVTVDVVTPLPAGTPTLSVAPSSFTFNATTGGSPSSQNLQVTASGIPASYQASAATDTGGNWLSINPASGTTPATIAVSADPTGLSAGTYTGNVTLTSADASNTPVMVGVTLVVGSSTPPPTGGGPLQFTFSVIDRQSGGSQRVLLTGQGSVDQNGNVTGSGNLQQFVRREESPVRTMSMGTWKATGMTGFSPASGGGQGGVLEITVSITPTGASAETGTMRIADTGTESGVTLAIDGGSTFVPTGAGRVRIRTGSHGGNHGGGDDGGNDDGGAGGRGGASGGGDN